MASYMELRAEWRTDPTKRIDTEGKAADQRLQAAESAAWKSRRGGSNV